MQVTSFLWWKYPSSKISTQLSVNHPPPWPLASKLSKFQVPTAGQEAAAAPRPRCWALQRTTRDSLVAGKVAFIWKHVSFIATHCCISIDVCACNEHLLLIWSQLMAISHIALISWVVCSANVSTWNRVSGSRLLLSVGVGGALRGALQTNFWLKLGFCPNKGGGGWPNSNFYKSLFLSQKQADWISMGSEKNYQRWLQPMAFQLTCPCKRSHSVTHMAFLLLEKVEGALGSSEP